MNRSNQGLLQSIENGGCRIPKLQTKNGSPGNDAQLTGIEMNAAEGPHRMECRNRAKCVIERRCQSDRGRSRILAPRHGRGAGMILLARHGDAILPNAHQSGDDPNTLARLLQFDALLDVRFEVA